MLVTWHYVPYTLALAGGGVGILALHTALKRRTTEARIIAVLMAAVALWSFSYMLELASTDLQAKIFWAQFKYFGIVTVPAAWLLFSLQYSGRGRLVSGRSVILLAIVPVSIVLAVWTNEAHHFFWTREALDASGTLSVLALPMGIAFWIAAAYQYIVFLVGTLLIAERFLYSHRLYRRQASAMLIATLVPWAGNAMFLAGLTPYPHLDLTPFAFTISCAVVAWALFRLRLVDLIPIAHAAIVEGMDDCVIVSDPNECIVELNWAAEKLLGVPSSDVIGQPLERQLSGLTDSIELFRAQNGHGRDVVVGMGDSRRTYDIQLSLLRDRKGRPVSKVIVLRDITERKKTEGELQKHRDRLEEMVRERTAELTEANERLMQEIKERKQAQHELEASRNEIRLLSRKLMEFQEEERKVVARDLKDGLGPFLASAKTDVEALLHFADMDDERVRSIADDVHKKLDGTLASIRRIYTTLRPGTLDEPGLISSIEACLRNFEEVSGIHCDWDCRVSETKLDQQATTYLYRILQEALSNVLRHAKASNAKVELYRKEGKLVLAVDDDGCGFDPSYADACHGIGLVSMRERANQIDGTLRVSSAVGIGTRVELEVPV
ncbi:MAG: PAS domain-containing protein [Candidatus Abyssobacteria bacterium SURF_17]|uniref:PAS domain-containing protein n=1 Tax=Candidatus Abyssobacteria bacterium SURF_17 TaxID=2093361 RepID=A0A419F0E9_9BACT|nr:MAG: PAS domain-containing protein [Candidatus Abyssubacteria bacterium SURF_17]